MNSYQTSNGYLLLFRGTDWHMQLSPEEIQRVMGDWGTWFQGLNEVGKLSAASPLENEGAVVSGKSRSVADAPAAAARLYSPSRAFNSPMTSAEPGAFFIISPISFSAK